MAATVRKFPPRQRALVKAHVCSVVSKLKIEILSQPELQSEVKQQSVPVHLPVPTQVTAAALKCIICKSLKLI